jgi:hypothetical protein
VSVQVGSVVRGKKSAWHGNLGPTAREVESSQLVDVIAKPSRVDDVPSDFSRLSTGQKPVAVFLNDFFSGAVPANLETDCPSEMYDRHI